MSGIVAHLGLMLGSVPTATSSTWDPAFKAPNITLSNDNFTATQVGFDAGATRGTLSHSVGQFYFEVKKEATGAGATPYIGIAKETMTTDAQVGNTLLSWSLLRDGRTMHRTASGSSITSAFADGDTAMVAVDLDAGRIWWGRNGTWAGDPAAGTGAAYSDVTGTIYPAVTPGNGGLVTARFRSADFSYSPPTGFTAWG